jgi:hypothetical protein
MSTNYDLCFQCFTVVHVVWTRLKYVLQKQETFVKIDVYTYRESSQTLFVVLELSIGFMGHCCATHSCQLNPKLLGRS